MMKPVGIHCLNGIVIHISKYLYMYTSPTVPPSPTNITPVKLEHAEQLELGYMPLRDDFEKV